MNQWKEIVNFNNYECSYEGIIRNKFTKRNLTPTINIKGYAYVSIQDNNKQSKSKKVHQLIAITWLANPDNKKTVDHINRIRSDNRVANLQWATHKEQCKNRKQPVVNNNKGIWKIDPTTNEKIKFYNTIKEASFDVKHNYNCFKNISSCARGKSKTAYGFKWKYDEKDITDKQNEIWKLYKLIKKNNYYISNYGRAKNNNRILKLTNDNGYESIQIQGQYLLIHILVVTLFSQNPNNYEEVNHKDGNKSNNHIDNLEWITPKNNSIHAIENNLRKNIKKVIHYDNNGNIINIYTCPTYASRALNINTRSINKCCKNELYSCGNPKSFFKYLDDIDDLQNMKISNTFLNNKFKLKIKKKPSDKTPKKIAVYDNNDKLVEICNTQIDASRKYNVSINTIKYHLNHDNICTSKYKFKLYLNELSS
ncbi:HNH endonuclease [Klosneuvirus KNV1]|uniref:HNH endonuclease n=1 Tax=Klosneuvirus KNV1 TaxID=1977640 RepID=A0A1V0SIH6_9VIRU|nr:HNH endonuclease [Klosneuvirus KNV1]